MAIKLGGMFSGLDTDAVVKEMLSGQRARIKSVKDKKTLIEYKEEAWRGINTKLFSFYSGTVSKMRFQGTYATKKATVSNDKNVSVTASTNAPKGEQVIEDIKIAQAQNITGNTIKTSNGSEASSKTKYDELGIKSGEIITVKNGDKEVKIMFGDDTEAMKNKAEADGAVLVTSMDQLVSNMKKTGINVNFDKGRLFLAAEESGLKNAFEITGSEKNVLNKLGLTNISKDSSGNIKVQDMSKLSGAILAKDAEYTLNGAKFTSDTNTVSINGMTITLKEDSAAGEKIKISISSDSSRAKEFVKDFVKEYNELIDEMSKKYSAPSSKGYKPLSDEQKKQMTEEEVKQWENKIKDSVLRRDSTLSKLTTDMRVALSESIEVDGTKYSLSNIGISTSSNWKEGGKLYIDESKLDKLLEEDPDKVVDILTKAGERLYTKLSDNSRAIQGTRSANKFYDDKRLTSLKNTYSKQITSLERRMSKMENSYYKQFTRLEQMLAKIQGNASALGIGGNQ